METTKLKRFAQHARKLLRGIVSTKIDKVLQEGSSARRENPNAIRALEKEINTILKEQVIEKVAYIWFNRFIALRFMDVNKYSKVNIVSPEPGQFQPSILSDAKMGHIDESIVNENTKEKVLAFLENRSPSSDPQGEAYKLLVVAACNYYNTSMPFLFERIEDYTELLMPDDLLSGDSILAYTREAMSPNVCKDVEVIGWLYQFYISEKKDEVFEGIKKNKKVIPENIPAATQLFTPNWIVRYMVENSLGRLWKLNNPRSSLHMEYYIEPETKESDYLKISSPTELKICDPACGSGHILVYAFDLLYDIYKEAGYTDDDTIVENIIKNNLYGIEIDERAAELAAFALTMKAASKSGSKRRFFRNTIKPNICKLEKIKFEDDEIDSYMDAVGRDLFTEDLKITLTQFEEADNFGSLIVPALRDVESIQERLKESSVTNDLFLAPIHEKVLQVLKQADFLSSKYHVVVANPPYMGAKGMSDSLKTFLVSNYEEGKTDLFSAFMIRNCILSLKKGQLGFMTPFVWMFILSYEKLRDFILDQKTLTSLIQLEYSGFDGATVPVCTFTLENSFNPEYLGGYIKLSDFKGSKNQAPKTLEAIQYQESSNWFYRTSGKDLSIIPGKPIAYWLSNSFRNIFNNIKLIGNDAKKGLTTAENDTFIRYWYEVEQNKNSYYGGKTWFPTTKGGSYRKWYGNIDSVVEWENDGEKLKSFQRAVIRNKEYYFKSGVTWNAISSSKFNARIVYEGTIPNAAGPMIYGHNLYEKLAMLNSTVNDEIVKVLSPSLNFEVGTVASIPCKIDINNFNVQKIKDIVEISKNDWDIFEESLDFKTLPLLQKEYKTNSLQRTYQSLNVYWKSQIEEMKKLEEENNDIFIKAYGLEDELKSEVPLKEITLTCNPPYRYDDKKSTEELEALLLTDTIKEYISYAVGVMFGRYSLDHDGLHIANQDETIEDVNKKFNITNPTFEVDDDNVIPILDGDWFTDDISERFFQFVKVTFGKENYEENIDFIADALNEKNKDSKETIRKYFIKDFYDDHVKRYKKRPIYWMFSSPKGSFQALIYMHRYKSDTVSVILNDYLRNFITKLEATKDNLEALSGKTDASKSEKTKALKDIENTKKMILECQEYADEIIYPLAIKKLEINLDKGVKYNYLLFGKALKKVTGLS